MFQVVNSFWVEHNGTAKRGFIRLVFQLLTMKIMPETGIVKFFTDGRLILILSHSLYLFSCIFPHNSIIKR